MVVSSMEGDLCLASLEYISIACNSSPQALQWGKNGLISFGAASSVLLYQPQDLTSSGKITSVLNGHKSRVNCVSWVESKQEGSCCLVSGSTDKSIILWEQSESLKWIPVAHLSGHTDAVCCVAGITTASGLQLASESKYIIVSSSADSSLKVWNYADASGANCIQTLTFGNGFALTLALTVLPSSEVPLLACGCHDTLIHLYAFERSGGTGQFRQALTLQGHEDWVRSLAFTSHENNVLLASGAQDCFIRIWKIHQREQIAAEEDAVKLPEKLIFVTDSGGQSLSFSVTLETVLAGHEGWIYGLSWYDSEADVKADAEPTRSTLCLLSASMDKTVMLWEPSEDSDLWIDKARMGEVGGNTLGFYGCAFSPDGSTIIAHGFQGGFHLWDRKDREEHSWSSAVTIGGHFGAVEDFDWDPEDYTFMISVSSDQTSRLHAPWRRNESDYTTWHEFARPQIHGYDLQCIAMINRYTYASGAEEKVIRIFRAPRKFHECLSTVTGVHSDEKIAKSLPLGASVPPLGLSNKAVFEGDLASWKVGVDDLSQPMKASAFASEDPLPFTPISITEPPTEDILLQNTLWPEEQKLYGHGYEVFCLACNPQGTVLASACKASKEEHANIILWDTSTWAQLGSLQGHSLTVTQMAFSHNGNWLLSVSRDRTWVLHKSKEDGVNGACPLELFQRTDKKSSMHSRIIWSCAWSTDDHHFITGSRDKKVIMWGYEESIGRWGNSGTPYVSDDAVTAVDIAPILLASKRYLVAVGMECGKLSLVSWISSGSDQWQRILDISPDLCPTQTVKRLRWAKKSFSTEQGTKVTLKLGCVSSDASLRAVRVLVPL